MSGEVEPTQATVWVGPVDAKVEPWKEESKAFIEDIRNPRMSGLTPGCGALPPAEGFGGEGS